MKKMLKNIEKAQVIALKELVTAKEHEVTSRTLSQNEHVSITLFAFAKGEEISIHASEGDAMVTVLEGCAEITINGTSFIVNEQETIVMPATLPHALFAKEAFKMILTVVFPK